MQQGKYVVIEGTDGSGKSTIGAEVIKRLEAEGIAVWAAHEPGSTPIGEAIRTIVKDASLERSPLTELLLFTAARAELAELIKQKLEAGMWVVSSRNYLSSVVYQGAARGLGMDFVQQICDDLLPDFYLKPNLTVVIDIDTEIASKRRQNRDQSASKLDTFESQDEAFQRKLVEAYRQVAAKHQLPLINGDNAVEQVADEVHSLVSSHLL